MYVIRWNVKAKRGHVQNVVNFMKGMQDSNDGRVHRLYANVFGDNDIVCGETEFADIESAAKFVEWVEGDAQAEIIKGGWYDVSAGNVVELWRVID